MMYDDMIDLPHHVSPVHRQMTREERAAQFSPFAALTGYERVIEEAGRQTEEWRELDEDAKGILDEKLRMMEEQIGKGREAEITYFQPDGKKEGGAYVTVRGLVKKIDRYGRAVVMEDGKRILMEYIVEVEDRISEGDKT